jgi:hypothetical protein
MAIKSLISAFFFFDLGAGQYDQKLLKGILVCDR